MEEENKRQRILAVKRWLKKQHPKWLKEMEHEGTLIVSDGKKYGDDKLYVTIYKFRRGLETIYSRPLFLFNPSLFHDFEYILSFGIGGGAQQFKKNHFCAGEMRAGAFDSVYSDLAVFRRARGNGIRDQMNRIAVGY